MTLHIARAPYRISLLGGSSDLDWWLNEGNDGCSIGFALAEYSNVVISSCRGIQGVLNYSSRETYTNTSEITHPIIREAFKEFGLNQALELASFGSSSDGGGLGGSSSFANALIAAIHSYLELDWAPSTIAQLSSDIEINNLNRPIGRQDSYLSALGGMNILTFKESSVQPLLSLPKNIESSFSEYMSSCVLVDSGINRSASNVLSKIKTEAKKSSRSIGMLRDLAVCMKDSIETGEKIDIDLFESLMIESWNIKKMMSGVLNQDLLDLETSLLSIGVKWLKLLGAGGGGSFLCKPVNMSDFMSKLRILNLHARIVSVSVSGVNTWKI